MKSLYKLFAPIAACVVLAFPEVPAWAGQMETPWQKTFRSSVRLVAATKRVIDGKDVLLAGIQVKLDKGWKTYWRNPGDAGLPPSFEWKGSRNLKTARVLWPAPMRFADPFGSSIGYEKEIIFPVAVEAAEPGKPVKLAVGFNFAVCKDICAPASAELTLDVQKARSPHDAVMEKYLAEVPVKVKPGLNGPSVAKVDIEIGSAKPHITVDAVFPGDAAKGDLFIEAPDAIYIPLTKRVADGPDGRVRFAVDLTKGDDPKVLKGKTLTLTLVSPAGNRETTLLVD